MNRDFKGVWIKKEIWLDENLTIMEKVLLVEIDSLSSGKKPCWASNRHFAEFFGLSERSISRYIKRLKQKGLIKIIDKTATGGQRFLTPLDKTVYPPRQNCPDPPDKTVYHSNTVSNTENNTNTCAKKIAQVNKKIFSPIKNNAVQTESRFSQSVECIARRAAQLGLVVDECRIFDWLEEAGWELGNGLKVNSYYSLDKSLRTWAA